MSWIEGCALRKSTLDGSTSTFMAALVLSKRPVCRHLAAISTARPDSCRTLDVFPLRLEGTNRRQLAMGYLLCRPPRDAARAKPQVHFRSIGLLPACRQVSSTLLLEGAQGNFAAILPPVPVQPYLPKDFRVINACRQLAPSSSPLRMKPCSYQLQAHLPANPRVTLRRL